MIIHVKRRRLTNEQEVELPSQCIESSRRYLGPECGYLDTVSGCVERQLD
jgi:hypothetical protein